MDDKPHEECGIIAVISKDPSVHIAQKIFQGLMALQHRGQEAAGISVYNIHKKIHTYKDYGLAFEALPSEELAKLWGNVGIGQVRYGTAGSREIKNAQPFYHENNQSPSFSIAFNGNITNYPELRNQLQSKGHMFLTNGDTEVIAKIIASNTLVTSSWAENIEFSTKILDGAYSIIILTDEGDVYAYRSGNKPLCYGKLQILNTDLYIVASESCAINSLGGSVITDVKPGEILHVHQDHLFHTENYLPVDPNYCVFEYVYFSRADSVIDGRSVHKTREALGINLAKEDKEKGYNFIDAIVVPVPDSGRSAALGYSFQSGIRYDEGLMKNRYVFRSFIQPSQAERMNLVQMKLNPVRDIIRNKQVILLDDSIVRGTTMTRIVKLLRNAGASEVHVRSSCPPVAYPCFYGVDFPSQDELIFGRRNKEANSDYQKTISLIREEIGADSLEYLSIQGLIDAVGIPKDQLCLACYNGKYWVRHERTRKFLQNGRI